MNGNYEQRLSDVEAKLNETNPRLVQGVERLGDETAGLNQILARVNEQQRTLTSLGEHVNTKASTATVQAAENAERRARVRQACIIAAAMAGLALVLGGVVSYGINADYHACVQRQERVDIEVAFIRDVSMISDLPEFQQRARQAAEALQATKVDCDALYPVHWGDSLGGLSDP